MNIAALKAELTAGHPGGDDYNADPGLAAAQINEVNRTNIVPIASTELLAWAGGNAVLTKLKAASEEHVSVPVQNVAMAAYNIIFNAAASLDLRLVDRMAMVDALVAGGVFSADNKVSLVALGTVECSRANEHDLAIGWVRPGDINAARRS